MKDATMKLAYVAGPITAANHLIQQVNVARAAMVTARLMNMGYLTFCPHTHSQMLHSVQPMPWDYWMELDLKILKSCDLLVCAPGWQDSKGAKLEVETARNLGIPVYESIEALSEELGLVVNISQQCPHDAQHGACGVERVAEEVGS